jgi:hypothetical protein
MCRQRMGRRNSVRGHTQHSRWSRPSRWGRQKHRSCSSTTGCSSCTHSQGRSSTHRDHNSTTLLIDWFSNVEAETRWLLLLLADDELLLLFFMSNNLPDSDKMLALSTAHSVHDPDHVILILPLLQLPYLFSSIWLLVMIVVPITSWLQFRIWSCSLGNPGLGFIQAWS